MSDKQPFASCGSLALDVESSSADLHAPTMYLDAQAVQDSWDRPGVVLEPDKLSWLGDSQLMLLLQLLGHSVDSVAEFLFDYSFRDNYDSHEVRSFFESDYLRCVSLLSELEYRLNNLG